MIGSRKVRCIKAGKSTAVFIDSQRLVDVLKDMGLLPRGWQPSKCMHRGGANGGQHTSGISLETGPER